jgi:hypothetical protein
MRGTGVMMGVVGGREDGCGNRENNSSSPYSFVDSDSKVKIESRGESISSSSSPVSESDSKIERTSSSPSIKIGRRPKMVTSFSSPQQSPPNNYFYEFNSTSQQQIPAEE